MGDNVKVNEGTGPVIATDEVGGAQHQRVKVEFGEDGAATQVSEASPLPVGGTALGTTGEADATGNGGVIGVLKRIRALLEGVGSLSLVPRTSGGLSKTGFVSAASTNATSAKGSPGQVYGWAISNEEANWIYLKFYDTSSAPAPGTTAQYFIVGVPPGGTASANHSSGIAFATGIGLGLTKGAANSNAEAVSASKVAVAVFWK